jgi:hypothetical protein
LLSFPSSLRKRLGDRRGTVAISEENAPKRFLNEEGKESNGNATLGLAARRRPAPA